MILIKLLSHIDSRAHAEDENYGISTNAIALGSLTSRPYLAPPGSHFLHDLDAKQVEATGKGSGSNSGEMQTTVSNGVRHAVL